MQHDASDNADYALVWDYNNTTAGGATKMKLASDGDLTIAGDLTVSGGDINGGKLDMAIGEKTIVIGEGAGALQDAHSRGNTFLGYEAGANSKAVGVSVPNGYNTFIGYRAGKGATSHPYSNGSWGNVAIGSDSFLVGESSTCTANVSVGQSSLKSCQDGKGNTAIGASSLENLNKDGQNNNTCIGYLSGHDIYWSAGIVPLVAYTFGVLIVGAGTRAVLKG